MEYTAVIRTLGKAGEKYQTLLNSLISQTLPPSDIYVYIADGYPIPKETVGVEKYVYVKKGMVAQRALQYDEVDTEYMLFLDDDVFLPSDSVALMFQRMQDHDADVISPDVFPNAERPFMSTFLMTISGRMRARRNDEKWGYKVMRTAGYSYNANPVKDVYWSQTNAGPCFLCKKTTMLDKHFEEELWLDKLSYPQGEDQVMYYKMYKKGYKQLTIYGSGILHMDAGGNRSIEKEKMLVYSDFRFKTIFWHRFLLKPDKSCGARLLDVISIVYALGFSLLMSLIKFRFDIFFVKCSGIKDGIIFLRGEEYKSLPRI